MTITSPTAFLFSILGSLIVAGVVAWIRRGRLDVLVHRSFTYQHLAKSGQLAELSIFNRGFKTEENVELFLSEKLGYQVVGSTTSDIELDGSTLRFSRIAPDEEVTVVLLVERGEFSIANVVRCVSKDNKGRVVSKLTEVYPTAMQRVGLVVVFVAVPAFLVLGAKAIDWLVDTSNTGTSAATLAGNQGFSKEQLTVGEWNYSSYHKNTDRVLLEQIQSGKINLSLGLIARKKDIVSIPVSLKNETPDLLDFRVEITAPGPQDSLPITDRYFKSGKALPGNEGTLTVSAAVTQNKAASIAERTVYIECRIASSNGQSLTLRRKLLIPLP